MKRIFRIFTAVLVGALWFSCSPDESSLGDIDVSPSDLVEGIAYKIEHDADNPNIIYLKSLMDAKYTPLWEHPQGRSQASAITLKMPFEGTYEVKFGVQTRGGVVYGEPVTFTIDDFYADFVNHELWVMLTGGVGNSKTWIHDNGAYGLASGEMDYADPSTTVEWNNFAPNWSPGKGHTGDENIWNSSMTFSLQGGAYVEIDDNSEGGEDESGTFMLDVDNHTITFTDANILHTQGWDFKTSNWAKNLKILTLTENQLQVAVFRELVSGEGEWWMVWNYVSKEYADNYVPEDLPDPVPPIDGDPNDVLTTTKSKTWVLSSDSPYDWADLNGGLINDFTGGEPAYLATGWAAYDADMIAATKFTFSSSAGNSGTFVFSSYNNEDVEGEYTIDQNNDITFDQGLNGVISESDFGWTSTMRLNTTEENKLRILKTKTDALGLNVTEMWLGQRSSEKNEYMVFHFVLGSGVGGEVDVAKVLKKQLTNNSSQTYKISLEYPFTWGRNGVHDFAPPIPDWTGWTNSETNINQNEDVRFVFNTNGDMSYTDNTGSTTEGTFQIVPADEGYGVNLIKFYGVTPNYEMTGVDGGWVWFNMNNNNVDPPVANMPTDTQFFELYEWEFNEEGDVTGLWFGKVTTLANHASADERLIYHLVIE